MIQRTTFFSIRFLSVLFVVVVLLYLCVNTGWLLWSRYSDTRRQATAERTEQASFDALSPKERAITRAEEYLGNKVYTMTTSERLFLSYLQRKFDLNPMLGIGGPPIDLYENPRTYPQEIHFLARIAYPDRLVKQPFNGQLEDIGVTNIHSANCDHIPLPSNYWDIMHRHYEQGGYYATHNGLAFAFMRENRCELTVDQQDLFSRTISVMASIGHDASVAHDLRYEAMAFLYLNERPDLVFPDEISNILAEQQEDGGWREDDDDESSNTHTSILALWTLLENGRPDVGDEPMIRHTVNAD